MRTLSIIFKVIQNLHITLQLEFLHFMPSSGGQGHDGERTKKVKTVLFGLNHTECLQRT